MLLKIRDFLKQHRIASNQQLAREFKVDIFALQPMLELWLQKGVIVRCEEKACSSGGCGKKCAKQRPVYYRYLANT